MFNVSKQYEKSAPNLKHRNSASSNVWRFFLHSKVDPNPNVLYMYYTLYNNVLYIVLCIIQYIMHYTMYYALYNNVLYSVLCVIQ